MQQSQSQVIPSGGRAARIEPTSALEIVVLSDDHLLSQVAGGLDGGARHVVGPNALAAGPGTGW